MLVTQHPAMLPVPSLSLGLDFEVRPPVPTVIEGQLRLHMVGKMPLLLQAEQDIRDDQVVLRAHHLTADSAMNEPFLKEPSLRFGKADGHLCRHPGFFMGQCVEQVRKACRDVREHVLPESKKPVERSLV